MGPGLQHRIKMTSFIHPQNQGNHMITDNALGVSRGPYIHWELPKKILFQTSMHPLNLQAEQQFRHVDWPLASGQATQLVYPKLWFKARTTTGHIHCNTIKTSIMNITTRHIYDWAVEVGCAWFVCLEDWIFHVARADKW